MAKLTARGRKAIVECTREYTAEQLQSAHDRRYPIGGHHPIDRRTWKAGGELCFDCSTK